MRKSTAFYGVFHVSSVAPSIFVFQTRFSLLLVVFFFEMLRQFCAKLALILRTIGEQNNNFLHAEHSARFARADLGKISANNLTQFFFLVSFPLLDYLLP